MSGKGRHAAEPEDRAVLVRMGDGAEVSEGIDVYGAMFVLRDGKLHLNGSWEFKALEPVKAGDLGVRALGCVARCGAVDVEEGHFVVLNEFSVTMLPDEGNAP